MIWKWQTCFFYKSVYKTYQPQTTFSTECFCPHFMFLLTTLVTVQTTSSFSRLFKSLQNVCLWQERRRIRGTWRRSPIVYVEGCCKYTKGKCPNSKRHLEATITKPKALESLQRTKNIRQKRYQSFQSIFQSIFVGSADIPSPWLKEGHAVWQLSVWHIL